MRTSAASNAKASRLLDTHCAAKSVKRNAADIPVANMSRKWPNTNISRSPAVHSHTIESRANSTPITRRASVTSERESRSESLLSASRLTIPTM